MENKTRKKDEDEWFLRFGFWSMKAVVVVVEVIFRMLKYLSENIVRGCLLAKIKIENWKKEVL